MFVRSSHAGIERAVAPGSEHLAMPRLLSLVTTAVLTLGVSACASDAEPAAEQTSVDHAAADVGVVHVHGLGVDPADGMLYAATHSGVFRIPESGSATRVAGRQQDTMGFAVAGPRTFIGSGHPDFQMDPDLPPRLGFIRSTDAGESWTNVSLSGEVDFHALRSVGGSIYGWDSGSGRLMLSTDDGKTWETRSRLGLRDFVVDPADPDVLLATTAEGLSRSTDGGRTFALAGGPQLVVLAWQAEGTLFGLDAAGAVHASNDGGASWAERGSLESSPEALTAERGVLYAAVSDRGIFESTDGGITWSTRYDEAASR